MKNLQKMGCFVMLKSIFKSYVLPSLTIIVFALTIVLGNFGVRHYMKKTHTVLYTEPYVKYDNYSKSCNNKTIKRFNLDGSFDYTYEISDRTMFCNNGPAR